MKPTLLSGAIALLLGASAGFAQTPNIEFMEDWPWSGSVLSSNGTVEVAIYLYSPSAPGGEVTIPSTFSGHPVGRVDGRHTNGIFAGIRYGDATDELGTNVTSVIIPSTVTNIGDWAFANCTGLTNVSIPSSVTSIGGGAFANCTSLTKVSIPASVTNIGGGAFANCTGLTNVNIPSGVTFIASGIFENCTGLTNVSIPSGVTSIGSGAFRNCTGLTNIIIPEGVTNIDDMVFENCTSLTNIRIPDYVDKIWAYTFRGCENLANVTIGSSVTEIGLQTFKDCNKLTNVTIGNSVTTIGDEAFANCTSLTNVTIPSSVTFIGENVFVTCSALESVRFLGDSPTLSRKFLWSTGVIFPAHNGTVYYPRGNKSWSEQYGGWLTEAYGSEAPPPAITSPLKVNGRVGDSFAYRVVANNSPTSHAAVGLPAGLNINASTGIITGKFKMAGVFGVTVSAANTGTGTASAVITFAIAKGTQTIRFSPAGTLRFQKGRSFTLSATPTSGLSATFASSNPQILSIKGNRATMQRRGTVTVTAKQGGNENYLPAKLSKRITIR